MSDESAAEVKDQVLATALALNTALPQAAAQACNPKDGAALRAGTTLAHELADCYEGRLRSFLNPHGRPLGSGSTTIRGHKPNKPKRTRPEGDEG